VRPVDASVILAETELAGDRFPAVVRVANAVGCQFHPEKSSTEGAQLLAAIVRELTRRPA
jgi:imidazoleglycerol phosphate synthase glutamine amidotransferase subunit HisH